MTVSSDVSQLLGLLGHFLNQLPLGNRSGTAASTRDASFADLLRQHATGSDHSAHAPVFKAIAQPQAPVQAKASPVPTPVPAAKAAPVGAPVLAAKAAPVAAPAAPAAAAPAAPAAAAPAAAPAAAATPAPAPATPAPSTSPTTTQTTPPSHPLSVQSQEFYSTLEMNSCGGTVTFANLTGNSADVLNVGDTWQFSIRNGPPNTPVRQLMDCWTYPPPYKTVGTTDAQGNLTLTGTVTQAQGGNQVWQPYYMQFPNTYAGYQDPNAPAGYRNVFIGGPGFAIQ